MAMDFSKWLRLARVDIKNRGEGNDVKVSVDNGAKCRIYQAKWFSKVGAGYVLETTEQNLMLELECQGAGDLLIRLKGIDKRNTEGQRIPLWVDYTRLAVNEKVVFWELKSQWHDKPYAFTRRVEDGEKVKVEISWAQHGYKGEELAGLLSLCSTVIHKAPAPEDAS